MTRLRILPLLLLFSVACSSSNSPSTAPEPNSGDQPRAIIENRASIDMDIYLLRGSGQSIRLGFLAGGEKTTFPLPSTVTAGSTAITFEARPVRRSGRAVRSEPFQLGNEEIKWSIPPQ
jgi:hypothetical protein